MSEASDFSCPRAQTRRRMLIGSGSLMALACVGMPSLAEAATGDQLGWRFCQKCSAMFYNDDTPKGACPGGGGGHLAQGFLFALHYDDAAPATNVTQYAWRFCQKCHALIYDGEAAKGPCPAGARHVPQGFNFGLGHPSSPGVVAQADWRFCIKCFVLFWNGGGNVGRCTAGGGHQAQGFPFTIPFRSAIAEPAFAVSEALSDVVTTYRVPIENYLKAQLGQADLVAKGYTLYDINFQLGAPNFQATGGGNFNYRLNNNYLYCKSRTPTVVGSYGDPAFEVHFDAALVGAIVSTGGKLHVDGLVASVPTITVKPRNVSGALLTTFLHFFQETEYGGRVIRQAMDQYLRIDLTQQVNTYLQQL